MRKAPESLFCRRTLRREPLLPVWLGAPLRPGAPWLPQRRRNPAALRWAGLGPRSVLTLAHAFLPSDSFSLTRAADAGGAPRRHGARRELGGEAGSRTRLASAIGRFLPLTYSSLTQKLPPFPLFEPFPFSAPDLPLPPLPLLAQQPVVFACTPHTDGVFVSRLFAIITVNCCFLYWYLPLPFPFPLPTPECLFLFLCFPNADVPFFLLRL